MKRAAALLLLTLTALGPIYEWGGPARRGVHELKARRYEAALQALRAARSEMPNSAVIPYDEALAHLGTGGTDSAQVRFREAMTLRGDQARAAAAYNLGNQSMRAERYAEAARDYREALRIAPGNLDAKRNLEEAIRRLRQSQHRPEPRAGGTGPPAPGGRENPLPQPSRGGQGETRQTPRGASGEFTRQEAEQWLQALEAERRARRQEGKGRPEEETGQRDW